MFIGTINPSIAHRATKENGGMREISQGGGVRKEGLSGVGKDQDSSSGVTSGNYYYYNYYY